MPNNDSSLNGEPRINQVKKSVQELSGILSGIAADNDINEDEIIKLHEWMTEHEYLLDRQPFIEVNEVMKRVLEDGVISSDEHAELLWMCERFTLPNAAFELLADEIRKLYGYLHGIAADGQINANEIARLQDWCLDHQDFRNVWPFDVTIHLLDRVLDDGRIDAAEHKDLLAFCADFGAANSTSTLKASISTTKDVCTENKKIIFKGMRFCFAGKCSEGDREEMSLKVTNRGGEVSQAVSNKLNYLVIGAKANPCWTYSPFGRRIDQALLLQKSGVPISIIAEGNFMQAIRVHSINTPK